MTAQALFRRFLWAAAAAAFALQGARAEPPRWSGFTNALFRTLDTSDGLPNLTVNAIAQDAAGFIWAGTSEGIGRWDGHQFRIYRSDPRQAGTMVGAQVLILHVGLRGELWAGSSAGELARLDRARDRFVVVGGRPKTASDDVRAIADDGEGGLWIGRASGLYHLAAAGSALDQGAAAGHDPAELAGRPILALLRHGDGSLWAATSAGLFRQPRNARGFAAVKLAAGVAAPAVRTLLADSAGRVWAGTQANGAFVLSADGSEVHRVDDTDQPDLGSADIESLAEASDGRIWMGTNGLGILSVDPGSWRVTRIRHRAGRPMSLVDDTVQQVFRDRSGLMWAATDNGLSHTVGQQAGVLTVFNGASGTGQGDLAPDVTAVLPLPDGRMLLGTRQNWLTLLDPAGPSSPAQAPAADAGSALPPRIVRGMSLTPAGQVLIASPGGLFRADGQGRSVTRIPAGTGGGTLSLLSVTRIGDIYWLACMDGLWWFDAASADLPPDALAAAIHKDSASDRLQDRRGRLVAAAPSGRLWVGTYTGLNLVDPRTHAVQSVSEDPVDPEALPEGMVSTLLTDSHGRLWVGTEGGGIAIMTAWNAGHPRFHRLGREDGVPNLVVDRLLQDSHGMIWASTDGGLARIDPDNFNIRPLGQGDGVAIQVYWASAGAITDRGELLFGGDDGMTIIRPDRLAWPSSAPLLAVTGVTAGGVAEPGFRFNLPGPKPPLVITPGRNSLEVAFAVLDYADPGRYLYAHLLEGVDRAWVPTDPDRRLAAYTNLPAGEFTLKLRAIRRAGGGEGTQVIETDLLLPVRVLKTWYQTRFSMAAAVILAAALLALLLRIQGLVGRRRRLALLDLVTKRTAELSIAADTLRDLGTIGQEITASTNRETAFAVLYRRAGGLFDAPFLAVCRVGAFDDMPERCFAMRDGVALEPGRALDAETAALLVRVVREQQEITTTAAWPPPNAGAAGLGYASLLGAPLIVKGRVIGTIVIGSYRPDAYAERETRIIRTLAAYTAIAFANADAMAELGEAQAQLHRLAYSDGLTGLPNRRVFEEQFSHFAERAEKSRAPFALILIDLDHFKQINDSYGHDAGDALLLETSRRLQAAVQAGDLVMRLGGDEFAILLAAAAGGEALRESCQRLSAKLSHAMPFAGRWVSVTASIGAALYPTAGEAQAALYKSADLALYDAKNAGRNGWRIYSGEDASSRAAPATRVMM